MKIRKLCPMMMNLHSFCSAMTERYERDSWRDKFWVYLADRISEHFLCNFCWEEIWAVYIYYDGVLLGAMSDIMTEKEAKKLAKSFDRKGFTTEVEFIE